MTRRRKPTLILAAWPADRAERFLSAILGWIVKAILIFLSLSLLWVLLYRFVTRPSPSPNWATGSAATARDRMDERSAGSTATWSAPRSPARTASSARIAASTGRRSRRRCGATRPAGAVLRGGSTISQQTAKNAFLWQGGGYFRKGLEAWFTLLIENLWSKRRIMEVYLNVAETGIGTYGVNAGAQRYFGHDADALSPQEAARIAAVFPLPKRRAAIGPRGFTRRYGNMIRRPRMRALGRRRDGLDAASTT